MADPTLPVQVPAGVRQGDEDGWGTVMPGSVGFSASHRGRKRDEDPLYGQQPKGHMEGNWDV